MDKIFIDTYAILDFMTNRAPFADDTGNIFNN